MIARLFTIRLGKPKCKVVSIAIMDVMQFDGGMGWRAVKLSALTELRFPEALSIHVIEGMTLTLDWWPSIYFKGPSPISLFLLLEHLVFFTPRCVINLLNAAFLNEHVQRQC